MQRKALRSEPEPESSVPESVERKALSAEVQKPLRQCPHCKRHGHLSRAEFRRHLKDCQANYWNQQRANTGIRVIVRNHALRNPGKDYKAMSVERKDLRLEPESSALNARP